MAMTLDQAKAALQKYEDLCAARDVTLATMEQQRQEILAPVAVQLKALEAEYEDMLAAADTAIETAKKEAADAIKQYGATVSVAHVQAVYTPEHHGWTDGLYQFAREHPELGLLTKFYKPKAPSVALRAR